MSDLDPRGAPADEVVARPDDVDLRPGELADLDAVVRVHLESFSGFFLTFMGPAFLREFYRALIEFPEATLIVATIGSDVVGFVGGAEDESAFFRWIVDSRKVRFGVAASTAVLQRPATLKRLLRAFARPDESATDEFPATLLSVAVDPRCQSKGVGKLLLDAFGRRMRSRGVARWILTTDDSPDNRAIAFYRREGYVESRRIVTPEGRPMLEFTAPEGETTGDLPVKRLHVAILTHIAWPEPADFKNLPLAQALRGRGHRVTIITGFPNYPLGRLYDGYRLRWREWEYHDDVRILRLPLYPDHSASGVKRMLNYLSFTAAAATLGLAQAGPTDVLFIYSPPMSLGIPARLFKKIRHASVLLDVVDLWPDAVIGSGMSKSPIAARVSSWFAKQAYRSADSITVLSEGFRRRVAEYTRPGVPVIVRGPWASDQRAEPASSKVGVSRTPFRVVHAGNMGVLQGLETTLAAAEILRNDDVEFELVGGGSQLNELRQLASSRDLDNVSLPGQRPADEMPEVLDRADALLVSLKPDPYLDINMPSKVASYLAAGKPLLASAGGDVANLVNARGVGLVSEPGDPVSLAANILRLKESAAERNSMGVRARELFLSSFSRDDGIAEYVAMIEKMGGSAEGGAPVPSDYGSEAERVRAVYAGRGYDDDEDYSDSNPNYLLRVQSVERAYLAAMRTARLNTGIEHLKVLDYGCGNGRWMGRWLAWGATSRNLYGLDVRPEAVDRARKTFPEMNWACSESGVAPFAAGSFDVVVQNLVASSILDERIRLATIHDMVRLVRPGGLLLWYDFAFNNPGNPDVRRIRPREAREAVRPLQQIFCRRLVLAPPVARALRNHPSAQLMLEAACPPVRTHYVSAFQRVEG